MDISYKNWQSNDYPNSVIKTEVLLFQAEGDDLGDETPTAVEKVELQNHSSKTCFECNLCNYKTSHEDRIKLHNKTHLLDSSPTIDIQGIDFKDEVITNKTCPAFTTVKLEHCSWQTEPNKEDLLYGKSEPSLNNEMQDISLEKNLDKNTDCNPSTNLELQEEKEDESVVSMKNRKSQIYILKCKLCKFKTLEKARYEAHLKCHEVSVIYQCESCTFKTIRYESFLYHMQSHAYKCRYCRYRATSQKYVQSHLQVVHKRTPTVRRRPTVNQKVTIEIESDPEMPFKCEQCSYKTLRSDYLMQHQVNHLISKSLMCNECGKMFALQRSLLLHMKTHLEKKHSSLT